MKIYENTNPCPFHTEFTDNAPQSLLHWLLYVITDTSLTLGLLVFSSMVRLRRPYIQRTPVCDTLAEYMLRLKLYFMKQNYCVQGLCTAMAHYKYSNQ